MVNLQLFVLYLQFKVTNELKKNRNANLTNLQKRCCIEEFQEAKHFCRNWMFIGKPTK